MQIGDQRNILLPWAAMAVVAVGGRCCRRPLSQIRRLNVSVLVAVSLGDSSQSNVSLAHIPYFYWLVEICDLNITSNDHAPSRPVTSASLPRHTTEWRDRKNVRITNRPRNLNRSSQIGGGGGGVQPPPALGALEDAGGGIHAGGGGGGGEWPALLMV